MRPRAVLGLILVALTLYSCASTPTTSPLVTSVPVPATSTLSESTSTPLPPGSLHVYTDPLGATLWVDQTPVGQTPWRGNTSLGYHDLQLALPGYQRWMTQTEVTSGAVLTVQVQLLPFLSTPLPFTPAPDSRWVRYMQWDTDSRGLTYALGNGPEEPKDWIWYHYDLMTGKSETLPVPQSHVDDQTRWSLGLCPLDRLSATWLCQLATVLYESPSGRRMIYAPPEVWYGPDGKTPWGGLFNMWYADVGGRNQVFLGRAPLSGEGGKPGLVWSPSEDWALIDVSYDRGIFYLAKTDGTIFGQFPLSGTVQAYLRIPPKFSPDGSRIAFAGTTWDQGGSMHHATWITTLADDSHSVIKVSDHVGLLQWAADSKSLYILDIVDEHALYRVGLGEMFEERVIAGGLPVCQWVTEESYKFGPVVPDMHGWALAPDESKIAYKIAYRADEKSCDWVVLQIAPGE